MLIFIIFLFLLAEPYIIVPQISNICFNNPYNEGTIMQLFMNNSYKTIILSNLEECIIPKNSPCQLVRTESNDFFSVNVYYCPNTVLEDELYLLLDDEDNSRVTKVIATIKDNTIGIAKEFYFYSSSVESSSEEDYSSYLGE